MATKKNDTKFKIVPIIDDDTVSEVQEYCEKKVEASALDSRIKELGGKLKTRLMNSGNRVFKAGRYSVQLEIRKEEKVDKFKMLTILKEYWAKTHKKSEKCPFIRTVEVLDEEELEKYLYNTPLPEDVILALDSCRTVNTTQALKYKVEKGDK